MSPRTTTRTRWTAKDAQEILDLWKTSGLSLQRFAKQQGVQVQRNPFKRDVYQAS